MLNADPFNIEAQKRIEEEIRMQNVKENWDIAMEHNPEIFAEVRFNSISGFICITKLHNLFLLFD